MISPYMQSFGQKKTILSAENATVVPDEEEEQYYDEEEEYD
jgi:hypothetical protein